MTQNTILDDLEKETHDIAQLLEITEQEHQQQQQVDSSPILDVAVDVLDLIGGLLTEINLS